MNAGEDASAYLPKHKTLPAAARRPGVPRLRPLARRHPGRLRRGPGEGGADAGRRAAGRPNAVKHFKWRPQGKRRLHQTPRAGEVSACRPWLEAEVAVVSPRAAVALVDDLEVVAKALARPDS